MHVIECKQMLPACVAGDGIKQLSIHVTSLINQSQANADQSRL